MARESLPRRRENARQKSVFLNLPYDPSFQSFFLAYVAGATALRLIPRATLEIPGSTRRLDRIQSLIRSCRYSIHDLSKVQLDRHPPATPRFNMPFELGLTVGQVSHGGPEHSWFVFERMPYRLQKSLSDLNGTDVYVHGGSVSGVFRELLSAFVRERRQPTLGQMTAIYEALKKSLPTVLHETGASSPFTASAFKRLSVLASALSDEIVDADLS
jgi:hypothetical protein